MSQTSSSGVDCSNSAIAVAADSADRTSAPLRLSISVRLPRSGVVFHDENVDAHDVSGDLRTRRPSFFARA